MTERGLPGLDGAPACPFVAFGDDREARSTSPDHRHRCFAETPPAPRAVAHQEAYCLSSAFPVCPTFQDWARREAAQARAAGERPPAAPTEPIPAPAAEPDLYAGWAITPDDGADAAGGDATPDDDPIERNPPRDWAAPPPWATGPIGSAGSGRPAEPGGGATGVTGAANPAATPPPTRPVEGQGLAGSPADRLAGGDIAAAAVWSASADGSASTAPDEELAGLVQSRSSGTPPAGTPAQTGESVSSAAATPSQPPVRSSADTYPPSTRSGKRPAVSSTRDVIAGPSWERLQTHEAYPAIKSGSSMRGLSRIVVLAGALGIAALALFMLPALLGIGGGGSSASASPSGSRPVSSASHAPTVKPAATPVVYILKKGDTLSKVANKFDVTLEELLAANPDIKNPNKVALGQEIIIPSAAGGKSAPAATPEPS